jgi:hypothetical protein
MQVWAALVLAGAVAYAGVAQAKPKGGPAAEKVRLCVSYYGKAGSERARAFVDFLRRHFTEVRQADVSTFTGKRVPDANVVILDSDSDYWLTKDRPLAPLRGDYDQPTITLGVFGAFVSSARGLKTSYY